MTANLVQVGAAHKFWWRTATATICMGLSEGETMATTGLTTVPSYAGPSETMTRLEAAINAAGMTVFARIDHGAAAAAAHVPLGPTELVIFGNAKGGTPLMQTNQAVGIDLPLKAVIYQDAAGKVWVAYNDPSWLVERHALGSEAIPIVAAMTSALKRIVARVTGSAIVRHPFNILDIDDRRFVQCTGHLTTYMDPPLLPITFCFE